MKRKPGELSLFENLGVEVTRGCAKEIEATGVKVKSRDKRSGVAWYVPKWAYFVWLYGQDFLPDSHVDEKAMRAAYVEVVLTKTLDAALLNESFNCRCTVVPAIDKYEKADKAVDREIESRYFGKPKGG